MGKAKNKGAGTMTTSEKMVKEAESALDILVEESLDAQNDENVMWAKSVMAQLISAYKEQVACSLRLEETIHKYMKEYFAS